MLRERKRILFMAEGITMTHFVRPAALAQALDPDQYEVCFWTPQRYHKLLRQQFHKLGNLHTQDPQVFLDLLAHGSPVYSAEVLTQYVHDDLKIIQAVQPDLVLGDFRLSLNISAPLAGVPFGSIFNAQWSPYCKQPAIVPELPLTHWVPAGLLNPVFALIKPFVYALHAKPVNAVRRAFGMPPISHDLRSIYMNGDLVLYPDVPDLVPVENAPENHHFIGPCGWVYPAPTPAWWNEVMAAPEPKVLITMGSSGPVQAVPAILEAIAQLPVKAILTTSGRATGKFGPNVYTTDLLPYEETARHCAAVISHGGTGGLYMTLAAGTPMLAIPNNVDNHLSTRLLVERGAGLSVRVEEVTPSRILRSLERLLAEPGFKSAAGRMATAIARYDTRTLFPQVLESWFESRGKPARQRQQSPAWEPSLASS